MGSRHRRRTSRRPSSREVAPSVLLRDFQAMIDRMAAELPGHYLDGVAAIEVSRKAVPHPTRAHVYTLGECIPLNVGSDQVTSRVVLYYGSFRALAGERVDFRWREEAWETLMHEVRHHLEWKARTAALEQYDWAAEQNFARLDGQPFDPTFYRSGEKVEDGVYRVDDDVFLERIVGALPETTELVWHGTRYEVTVPQQPLPLYLVLDGVEPPPPGEAILVFQRRARLRDLFRGAPRPSGGHAGVQPAS